MDFNKPSHLLSIKKGDAPIDSVQVYRNQAEVSRVLTLDNNILKLGEQYIVLQGAPATIDDQTIRVSPLLNNGAISVLEVSFRRRSEVIEDKRDQNQEEEVQRKKSSLEAELADLQNQRLALTDEISRSNNKMQFLSKFVEGITQQGEGNAKVQASLLKPDTLENVTNFTSFYKTQLADYDAKVNKLRTQVADLDTKMNDLRSTITKLLILNSRTIEHREIIILISCTELPSSSYSFQITYLVSNSKWHAQYDIRVHSDSTIILSYFAVISQQTGESWKNVKLLLSTAEPTAGKRHAPLKLPSMLLAQQQQQQNLYYNNSKNSSLQMMQENMDKVLERGEKLEDLYEQSECLKEEAMSFKKSKPLKQSSAVFSRASSLLAAPSAPPPRMQYQEAKVSSNAAMGGTSATFTIGRAATTIPSDNEPHKVSIAAAITLEKCTREHVIIPSMDEAAYLKIKAINTSEYTLLAGEMTVFFDNTYIGKSKIKGTVNPAEEFEAYLGVDEQVKVEYKIPQKFREKRGNLAAKLINQAKNKQKITNKTVIKNNKKTSATVIVKERFPESSNKEIEVALMEPMFKEVKENKAEIANLPLENVTAKLVKLDFIMKQIEWEIVIEPNQKVTVPMTFEMQWPSGKEIQLSG